MAAFDAVALQAHPDQHVAPECFGDSEALAAAGRIEADVNRSTRQPVEDLLDQQQTLVDFANTNPDAGIDVTGIKHRNVEAELVIRRVLQIVPRIEGAAACAAHIAAGAVLTHERRLRKPGTYGPILQRRGVAA